MRVIPTDESQVPYERDMDRQDGGYPDSPTIAQLKSRTPPDPAIRQRQSGYQAVTRNLEALSEWLGHGVWPVVTTLLAVTLLTYGFMARNQIQRLSDAHDTVQQEVAVLRTDLETVQASNTELRQQLVQRENLLALFTDASRVVNLEGTETAPNAAGTFYVGEEASVLALRGLEPLPEDRTYELWLIPQHGDPIPLGLIAVDSTGSATEAIAMEEQPQEFAAVGLSIEPAGGSEHPTGPIVLLGTAPS